MLSLTEVIPDGNIITPGMASLDANIDFNIETHINNYKDYRPKNISISMDESLGVSISLIKCTNLVNFDMNKSIKIKARFGKWNGDRIKRSKRTRSFSSTVKVSEPVWNKHRDNYNLMLTSEDGLDQAHYIYLGI
jgi:hypothetical protein